MLTEQDHLTQLHLMSALDAAPQPVDLKLENGEPVYAKAVGLTAEHLLVADNDGKLYHAPLPEAGEPHATLTPVSTSGLNAALGTDHLITGFAHDEHGQMQALATDRQGQNMSRLWGNMGCHQCRGGT